MIVISAPEPTLSELSVAGRSAVRMPETGFAPVPIETLLPDVALRSELLLPELSQLDVTRHFVRLSQKNAAIDTTFYPLGSCTMKFNPKIHEDLARLSSFAELHPMQSDATVQGALQLMFELQQMLC